ncbi:MAG TPA: hypothetical protein VGN20_13290 [Mucilaginibacter sp.]|jgi:hypothetical protein
MGYIVEPKGVDFVVTPSTLTEADAKAIHEAIATYKKSKTAVSSKTTAPVPKVTPKLAKQTLQPTAKTS